VRITVPLVVVVVVVMEELLLTSLAFPTGTRPV